MKSSIAENALRYLYVATPLFVAFDFIFSANVRMLALEDFPLLRILFYLLCFLIGLFAAHRPLLSSVFALVESAVSIAFLVINFMSSYFSAIQNVADGAQPETLVASFGLFGVLNLLLSGSILIFGFYANPLFKQFRN